MKWGTITLKPRCFGLGRVKIEAERHARYASLRLRAAWDSGGAGDEAEGGVRPWDAWHGLFPRFMSPPTLARLALPNAEVQS